MGKNVNENFRNCHLKKKKKFEIVMIKACEGGILGRGVGGRAPQSLIHRVKHCGTQDYTYSLDMCQNSEGHGRRGVCGFLPSPPTVLTQNHALLLYHRFQNQDVTSSLTSPILNRNDLVGKSASMSATCPQPN